MTGSAFIGSMKEKLAASACFIQVSAALMPFSRPIRLGARFLEYSGN